MNFQEEEGLFYTLYFLLPYVGYMNTNGTKPSVERFTESVSI